jgi:hypothetical protein
MIWDRLLSVLVGVAVSYYFYQKDQRAAVIEFWIDSVKIVDARSMGAAPLTVVDAAGKRVEGNVYAANVTIWNSGNVNLVNKDVRQPFAIALGGRDTRLIDIQPTYFSNGNEDHIAVSLKGVFSWENLDPGEGVRARVVFATAGEPSISVTGHAPGARLIAANANPPEAVGPNTPLYLKAASVALLLLSVNLWALFLGWTSEASKGKRIMQQLGGLAVVLVLAYLLGRVTVSPLLRPPF